MVIIVLKERPYVLIYIYIYYHILSYIIMDVEFNNTLKSFSNISETQDNVDYI